MVHRDGNSEKIRYRRHNSIRSTGFCATFAAAADTHTARATLGDSVRWRGARAGSNGYGG